MAGPAAAAALLMLLMLLTMSAAPAAACNGFEVRDVNLAPCSNVSAVNIINTTINLHEDCKLRMRICFGSKRTIPEATVTYTVVKGLLTKRGQLDLCKLAREEYDKTEQKLKSRGGNKPNKYKCLLCPMKPGLRCITRSFDLSAQKGSLGLIAGTINVRITSENGDAGYSCMAGNFVLGQRQAGKR